MGICIEKSSKVKIYPSMKGNKKQTWESYWEKTDKSFFEQQIQRYKVKWGYEKLINVIPKIKTIGKVLEVGAGKARLSQIMRDRGWYTTAIDLEPSVVKDNKDEVEGYIIGDMFCLPFKNNSFDLVISCGLLEHFTLETVKMIISEIKRVGRSVVAWLPTCGLEWRIMWTVRNLLGGDVYTQAYEHRKESLADIFVAQGFQDVRVGVVCFAGIFRYIYVYGTLNSDIKF